MLIREKVANSTAALVATIGPRNNYFFMLLHIMGNSINYTLS